MSYLYVINGQISFVINGQISFLTQFVGMSSSISIWILYKAVLYLDSTGHEDKYGPCIQLHSKV